MPLADRLAALLETLRPEDLAAMVPVERRRFADRCRRLAEIADRVDAPRVGVLSALREWRPWGVNGRQPANHCGPSSANRRT